MKIESLRTKSITTLIVLVLTCCTLEAQAQMIVAHRGASFDAPENTLAAFNLAWRQLADGIECDIRLSKDGHLVCIHDKDTERVSGKKLVVSETTLAELRKLDVGNWKDAKWSNEKIPTLAEVLATAPAGKKVFIELKAGPNIVAPLCRELKRIQFDLQQVVIISFDKKTIAETKRRLPNAKAHWLTSFEQDNQTGNWSPSATEILATLTKINADGLGLNANPAAVSKNFLQALRNAGKSEFHVWTVNEPDVAKRFSKLQALGITTDRPKLIRQSLNKER